MLNVTYEHICDSCGNTINTENYQTYKNPPLPNLNAMWNEMELCVTCTPAMQDAIRTTVANLQAAKIAPSPPILVTVSQ